MPLDSAIVEAMREQGRRGIAQFRMDRPMRGSEWAAEHFYLSTESSYREGRWEAYPYQVAILDCMCDDAIEEVYIRKSARVGYTKMLLASTFYFAHHKRRSQAIWQPTDDDRDEFVKTELETAIRDIPAVQDIFPTFQQRHKDNTLRQKVFLGCMLHLRGGTAARNFRRLTVSVASVDEIDGFVLDVEGEGRATKLAAKRLEGATFPKLIAGSTPHDHPSQIKQLEDQAEKVFLWHFPCVHCDAMHPLEWGGEKVAYGMKWMGEGETLHAWHVCKSCGGHVDQAGYLARWHEGRWIATDGTWIGPENVFYNAEGESIPAPRSVALPSWTAMSPQTSWEAIVRQFLDANRLAKQGDTGELKTFVNLTLGEVWREEGGEKAEPKTLMERAEAYRLRTVPAGVLFLFAAVDVQDDRFEVSVWGYGRGEESWLVDHTVLAANPAMESDWVDKLDAYLLTRFPCAVGGTMALDAIAVDTGGHFTHEAYNFCRARKRRRVYAIKGENRPAKPVKSRSSLQDVNFRGKTIPSGVRLWFVGTDTAKNLLHGRLGLKRAGPGYIHTPSELEEDFYEQLTGEERRTVKTPRGSVTRWVKKTANQRVEVRDCWVYAAFCAHAFDLPKYTLAMWMRREARLRAARAREQPATSPAPQPAQSDHVGAVTHGPVTPPAPQAPRRSGVIRRIGRLGGGGPW